MRAATCAGLVGLALLAGGCGGAGGNTEREAVTRYLQQVNDVEAPLQAPIAAVSVANRRFSLDSAKLARLQPELRRSRRTLETLHRRLAALRPPARAKRLHALLLGLVEREQALESELAAVPVFLPRYRRALAPLAGATTRLRAALKTNAGAAAEAAALERYAGDLRAVSARLRPLRPPPLLAAGVETQARTLARVRAAAAALAGGLRTPAPADLPTLVGRLDAALRSGGSVSAQKAQIAALKAYNRRVAALAGLERRIESERQRLERALPT